jgi:uncharacterized protein (DUF58 family)
MRLRCSDPFGWLECEVSLPTSETLLVYPLIAPLETLGLPSVQPFGDYAGLRYLLEDPLRVAGVRDYVLGDDPRRIHWKATAHTGSLRSKIYEPSSFRRLLVLLDAWNYSDEVKGIDTDIQEFTISATASIALWGLDEGYMVGLLTNCGLLTASNETLLIETDTQQKQAATQTAITTATSPPGVKVPFALDAGQRERILTLLARLVPTTNTTMERLIDDIEDTMFPLGTTIILVSAASSLTEETIDRLDGLRMRGAAVHLALTNNMRENTLPDTYNLPVHMLGGKEQWFALFRNIGVSTNDSINATPLRLD